MKLIRLIGRNSRLSLLQVEIVRQKIRKAFPGLRVEIIAKSSRGDQLPDVPLHTVEGTDFFTADIFAALASGEADIAVHSLKDMSSDHFFGPNRFAVVDRDDPRDIALFHPGITAKLQEGKPIVIGTCSPRREEMALSFLKQALPQLHPNIRIETKPIRGNIETRLKKLDKGHYDGTILATAGLNRLLRSRADAPTIRTLLQNKQRMLLPLFECVPAPCQGAIVAEATAQNTEAVQVLEAIDDPGLTNACTREKKIALQFGKGCLQRFGVTTIPLGDSSVVYAAGTNEKDQNFEEWYGLPAPITKNIKIFSSTDYMGSFFDYEFFEDQPLFDEPVAFVSNFKAVRPEWSKFLQHRRVWAAGTKTWLQLAGAGIWVEGCADALGLESLCAVWTMPVIQIKCSDARIITNQQSSGLWQLKGWNAVGTYRQKPGVDSDVIVKGLQSAGLVFWTSHRQYLRYKQFVKKEVVHACPSGETAELLRLAGLAPIVFPTIKSFIQWRKDYTPSHSVA